jgi:NADPH:quinone reductase-like Zn-dependent oxidoreductase
MSFFHLRMTPDNYSSDFKALHEQLSKMGADHVLTYDDLLDKNLSKQIKEWTEGKVRAASSSECQRIHTSTLMQKIRLALNCIGGKETSLMASLLGHDAHLVSYGAMSKQPLSLPTSLFIFKNLTSHGFWQNRWYSERNRQDREKLMSVLASLMSDGKARLNVYPFVMWLTMRYS